MADPGTGGGGGASGNGTWNSGASGNGTWSYDSTTSTLTINGEGLVDFEGGSPPWSDVLPTSDSFGVIIGKGITGLGDTLFGYTTISNIELPNTLQSIGISCFRNCYSITSIEFPTSLKSIGMSAFRGCKSLSKIYFKSKSAPSMANWCFVLSTSNTTVYARVYTTGWGSDAVFTDSVRNLTQGSINRLTTFNYFKWTPPADEPEGVGIPVNVSGTWKSSTPYVNVNGTWKEVTNAYVNVNGTWKENI